MNRREFIRACQLLGISTAFQPIAASADSQTNKSTFDGSVIIIGAGAAGLASGHLLSQQGISFKILEALSYHGGRMKRTTDFADFPIPLGAEWIHVNPAILDEIVNDEAVDVDIETTLYNPDTDWALYEGDVISIEEAGFAGDSKFINATWFDFFEQYVVPSVETQIQYNTPVKAIDYRSEKIRVETANELYLADRVIITVPVKLLQNGALTFKPALPSRKQNAIDNATVWDGCKAFIEFSEKFYPAVVEFDLGLFQSGQKLYYDAAYGQNSSQNILGLFAVGVGAQPYINLSDDELIAYILEELDELSDGKASSTYIKHTFQNWNAEPYAQGAYVIDDESWRLVRTLGKSVDNRLFFAGDAYTDGEDWSSVHTAARSAKRAVKEMLN